MNSHPTTIIQAIFLTLQGLTNNWVFGQRAIIVCCHTLDKYVFPHFNVYHLTLFRETRAALMRHQLREESTILWTFVTTRNYWATIMSRASSRPRDGGRLPTTESSFWTICRNAKFPADTLNFDNWNDPDTDSASKIAWSVLSILHLLIIIFKYTSWGTITLHSSRQNEPRLDYQVRSHITPITSLGKLQDFCTQSAHSDKDY